MTVSDEERKRRGRIAEDEVCRILRKRGLQIIARNVNFPRIGEIDIIALDEDRVFVVEVKARQNKSSFGGPLAAVTRAKLSKITKATNCYLKINGMMNNYVTILAAGVLINKSGEIENVEIVPVESL
jgi:Holliday junction resolvase-like predicted endonuclease